MPQAAIKAYLSAIEQALKTGQSGEHTHRPALEALLEALGGSGVDAINEPRQIACGAPDFIVVRGSVPLGYVEAKDVGSDLGKIERSEQLGRYRESLGNLVLTDYLEFRWYLDGELRLTARLPQPDRNGRIRFSADAAAEVAQLLQQFLQADIPLKSTPSDLATRMAGLAKLIRDLIDKTFKAEDDGGELHGQLEAFRKVLIESLSVKQFADMYAQTLCYGLFAARCNAPAAGFTRQKAASALPKTNPFLRKLFNTIAGPDLDERIAWAVDQLAELLARADMAAILSDFGRRTRQEDPVVHFYETFLAAYDPKMREARGVYYTPEPVVGYIVRSVDALLKRDFGMKDGLAHSKKIKLKRPKAQGKGSESYETHRLQILDPATGTGTFLYAVIARIREHFDGNAGAWPGYVAEHLLPRLFGFELLMAPYAVAHMKLGLELEQSGYDFHSDERLGVFLTNTLEEAHELSGLPLFTQWLAEESRAASSVKRDAPVMVVLGNPPYSGHSVNKGKWIEALMDEYKQSPALKKPAQAKWLSDDYVKFIRFAQWRIEQTGHGVLGFVTNHGYLDNPTFMDMRRSLMRSFDEIYLLDLHGNSKKKEKTPEGGKDDNVFDIQQGVAIGIFVKHPHPNPSPASGRGTEAAAPALLPLPLAGEGRGEGEQGATQSTLARVFHADLYGTRAVKYTVLDATTTQNTTWAELAPTAPAYLFIPQDAKLLAEYEAGWALRDLFAPLSEPVPGFATQHDDFAISWSSEESIGKVERFLASETEAEARELFSLCGQSQWRYSRAKSELPSVDLSAAALQLDYRPFDQRWTIDNRNVLVHRRERITDQMIEENTALVIPKNAESFGGIELGPFFVVSRAADLNLYRRGGAYLIPLWVYPRGPTDLLDTAQTERKPNLAPDFIAALTTAVGHTPTPEDTLAWIYAVLYAPSYRSRYADFLKRDFPRVPLTTNRGLFDTLVAAGRELVALHTMDETLPRITRFDVAGSNEVVKVRFVVDDVLDGKSTPPQPSPATQGRETSSSTPPQASPAAQGRETSSAPFLSRSEGEGRGGVALGRVYINDAQYFDDVPQPVWDMHIGGYRVAEKWLKDRKGRQLGYDELTHYQSVIAALARTLQLQAGIDAAIADAGGWPLS